MSPYEAGAAEDAPGAGAVLGCLLELPSRAGKDAKPVLRKGCEGSRCYLKKGFQEGIACLGGAVQHPGPVRWKRWKSSAAGGTELGNAAWRGGEGALSPETSMPHRPPHRCTGDGDIGHGHPCWVSTAWLRSGVLPLGSWEMGAGGDGDSKDSGAQGRAGTQQQQHPKGRDIKDR